MTPSCSNRRQMNIIFLMETMYLTHPACRLHEMGSWHPESPQRLDAISDQLLASGLMPYLTIAGAASLAPRHSAGPYRSVPGQSAPARARARLLPDRSRYPDEPAHLRGRAVRGRRGRGRGRRGHGGEARTAFVRCVRPAPCLPLPGHGLLLPEQRGHRGPPRAGLPRPVAGGHRGFRRAPRQWHRRRLRRRRAGADVQLLPAPVLSQQRRGPSGRQHAQRAGAGLYRGRGGAVHRHGHGCRGWRRIGRS